jgi:hypothetical protein
MHNRPSDVARYRELTMNDVILKPFKRQQLLTAMRTYIPGFEVAGVGSAAVGVTPSPGFGLARTPSASASVWGAVGSLDINSASPVKTAAPTVSAAFGRPSAS